MGGRAALRELSRKSFKMRNKTQTLHLACNLEALVATFKDEAVYRAFHVRCGDKHIRVDPCVASSVWRRSSGFSAPIESSAARMATGSKRSIVEEVTTIAQEQDGSYRIKTAVKLSGAKLLERTTATCELVVRQGPKGCTVHAEITTKYRAKDFYTSSMEQGFLTSLFDALKKWLDFAVVQSRRLRQQDGSQGASTNGVQGTSTKASEGPTVASV